MPPESSHHRAPVQSRFYDWAVLLSWVALLLPMGGILAASFVLSPEGLSEGRYGFVFACPSKTLLGHACPTCGMSRAFAAISHGRLTDALQYNAAAPAAYAFIWLGALLGAVQSAKTIVHWRVT